MKRAPIEYQANDGTRFATVEECKRHERDTRLTSLINMNGEQVMAALDRTDIPLADAIEYAGKLIADKRRAMGGAKRKRKPIAEKHVEGAATIATAQEHSEGSATTVASMQPKKKSSK